MTAEGSAANDPGEKQAPPHRRLRLRLDLEGDELAVIVDELYNVAERLTENGSECQSSTSGGRQHGYHYDLTVTDPDMDSERFAASLQAWVEARRANRT